MCSKCLNTSMRTSRRTRAKKPDLFRDAYHSRKAAGLCVSCGVPGKERTNGLLCSGCAKTENQRTVRTKWDAMQKYGGKCYCCGETRIAFLTIDHINNDGHVRKKVEGAGGQFYRRLLKAPVDPTLRASCYNCNCGRRTTGVCPHQDNSYFDEALSKERWQRRAVTTQECVKALQKLGPGWDGYKGRPITQQSVDQAFEVLHLAQSMKCSDPQNLPTFRGGIQFEWSGPGKHLEVECLPDGSMAALWERGKTVRSVEPVTLSLVRLLLRKFNR